MTIKGWLILFSFFGPLARTWMASKKAAVIVSCLLVILLKSVAAQDVSATSFSVEVLNAAVLDELARNVSFFWRIYCPLERRVQCLFLGSLEQCLLRFHELVHHQYNCLLATNEVLTQGFPVQNITSRMSVRVYQEEKSWWKLYLCPGNMKFTYLHISLRVEFFQSLSTCLWKVDKSAAHRHFGFSMFMVLLYKYVPTTWFRDTLILCHNVL